VAIRRRILVALCVAVLIGASAHLTAAESSSDVHWPCGVVVTGGSGAYFRVNVEVKVDGNVVLNADVDGQGPGTYSSTAIFPAVSYDREVECSVTIYEWFDFYYSFVDWLYGNYTLYGS